MAIYNTQVRYGGTTGEWRDFYPLEIIIVPKPGEEAGLTEGNLSFAGQGGGEVHKAQVTFAGNGSSFNGSIRVGAGADVDYKGTLRK